MRKLNFKAKSLGAELVTVIGHFDVCSLNGRQLSPLFGVTKILFSEFSADFQVLLKDRGIFLFLASKFQSDYYP